MDTTFLDDLRWCSQCGAYVNYLQSFDAAFCVHCDRRVQILRRADWQIVLEPTPVFPPREPRLPLTAQHGGGRRAASPV